MTKFDCQKSHFAWIVLFSMHRTSLRTHVMNIRVVRETKMPDVLGFFEKTINVDHLETPTSKKIVTAY